MGWVDMSQVGNRRRRPLLDSASAATTSGTAELLAREAALLGRELRLRVLAHEPGRVAGSSFLGRSRALVLRGRGLLGGSRSILGRFPTGRWFLLIGLGSVRGVGGRLGRGFSTGFLLCVTRVRRSLLGGGLLGDFGTGRGRAVWRGHCRLQGGELTVALPGSSRCRLGLDRNRRACERSAAGGLRG